MPVHYSQDPWTRVRTRHDIPADEIISALQKEIRRGHTENAALIAYEMMTTSAELEAYMWKRLLCISVEDVGFGNPQAASQVYTLFKMHEVYQRGEGDRLLFGIHAVRVLCLSQKDRSTDELVNWMHAVVEEGGRLPEIPDYALDMHTARGQQMGRDLDYFLAVGSQVEPELADRDRTYRQRLLEIVAERKKAQ
ncbi:AAA family ATPase [Levilinea saccharolytica]|uniref:ATPase related to the helicase subunit of the Holliday junction resolvase n=1 Tax=Levilinea saccharolytica TaxID=229921 RepID=A0A0M8JPP6_9CHLR|nr:hypothetical protein [Levilinea saccharolytica]KPL80907.1 hypothetical protein ADN01_10445 [Levilinea saccharolytica]GAP19321.1 ATPase related to the helicase subunit of the Holliday junction resolvase [Levilinea saccharolytica]